MPPTKLIPSPVVKSKFDLGCHYQYVACLRSGKTWVNVGDRKLHLVDMHGTVKSTISTDFDFEDVVISQQDEILLSDITNNCIKAIPQGIFSISRKTICKFNWKPSAFCCLLSGNIAMAFFDEGRIAVFSMSGKVVQELENKMFRHPYRIAQNKVNSDLYISDRTDGSLRSAGKVLALNINNSKVLFVYTGQYNKESFYPCGLCTDDLGHVLITDLHNNSVHILDKEGHFLQYLLTGNEELTLPYSVAVDNEGNAWVGEYIGSVKVVNYLQ